MRESNVQNVRRKHPGSRAPPPPPSLGALPCLDGGGAEGAGRRRPDPILPPLGPQLCVSGWGRLWRPRPLICGEQPRSWNSPSASVPHSGQDIASPQRIPRVPGPRSRQGQRQRQQEGRGWAKVPRGGEQPCAPCHPPGSPGHSALWLPNRY